MGQLIRYESIMQSFQNLVSETGSPLCYIIHQQGHQYNLPHTQAQRLLLIQRQYCITRCSMVFSAMFAFSFIAQLSYLFSVSNGPEPKLHCKCKSYLKHSYTLLPVFTVIHETSVSILFFTNLQYNHAWCCLVSQRGRLETKSDFSEL